MRFRTLLVLSTGAVVLAACSTNTPQNIVERDQDRAKVIEAQNQRLEQRIESLPDWVLHPPQPDHEGVFAVGTAESDNLQIAVNKARLEAEFGLAKLYGQELSGTERMYHSDSTFFSQSRYQGVIDKLVSEVPVVGFSTEKQEIGAVNGRYSVFVLLKLPYDEFNKVVQQRQSRETSAEMKEAFNELHERIEQRKQALNERNLSIALKKQGQGNALTDEIQLENPEE